MAWAVDYADTAKGQLSKLDRQTARRILDFMDERIAGLENPRNIGKALTGRWAACGDTEWVTAG